jgi:hypothetical protein
MPQSSDHPMQTLQDTGRSQTTNDSSLLPSYYTNTPIRRPSITHSTGSTQSDTGSVQLDVPPNTREGFPDQDQDHDTELYWCVNGAWKNAKDLMVSRFKVSATSKDSDLFRHLENNYFGVRGKFRHFFSWKSCEDVEFIKVRCIKTLKLKSVGLELSIAVCCRV